jgi:hypothetical protein
MFKIDGIQAALVLAWDSKGMRTAVILINL